MLEIENDTSLACVGMQEDMPHPSMVHGADMAHVVAFRGLHLDDLCAQLRQDLGRKRPHDDRGQVENLHTCQRTGGGN